MTTDSAVYDFKDQYDQIVPWVISGEKLHAVFDLKGMGTGFVGITNKRLIFYDKAFANKRKALTSIPFNKITAVSSIDKGRGGLLGLTSSELVIKTGSEEFEFEFFGGEKAQKAYQLIMTELLQSEPA